MQRIQPAANPNAMTDPEIARELLLEVLYLRPEDKPAASDDALGCSHKLLSQVVTSSTEVQERNGHGGSGRSGCRGEKECPRVRNRATAVDHIFGGQSRPSSDSCAGCCVLILLRAPLRASLNALDGATDCKSCLAVRGMLVQKGERG